MTQPTYDGVIAEAERLASENNVRLKIELVPFFWEGDEDHGHPWESWANPYLGISVTVDPLAISPKQLWVMFCHELGHEYDYRERGVRQLSPWQIHYQFTAPDSRRREELAAWKHAERIARTSPWPPDAEFYRMRRYALSTYGVYEEAA